MKSSGENWRGGKGGASSPDTPQARSSGTDRTHSCPDAPALDKGRLPQPLPTRDQAKPPRSSPGRLLRLALLTCSSCQPPSVPFCAEWTATSRSAPPFPVFPGLHTYHPQHKQTPGRASPLIPPPASHPRRLRTPRPDASTPCPRRGTRKRTVLDGTRTTQWAERRLWEEREGAGKKAGLLPPGDLIGYRFPRKPQPPPLVPPAPPAITTVKPKRVGFLIVRLKLLGPGCAENGKH